MSSLCPAYLKAGGAAVLLPLFLAASLLGQGVPVPERKAPRPSRGEKVAAHFHRPAAEVALLRDQGLGFGEVVKILVIADMSRQPLPKLLKKNREGYGWGTISRQLGLDVVEVKKRVDQARRELGIRVRLVPPPPLRKENSP